MIGFRTSNKSQTWTGAEPPATLGDIAIPVDQVRRVQGRRVDGLATAGLTVLVTIGSAYAFLLGCGLDC